MTIVEKPKGDPFDNGPKRSDGQYERYAVLPQAERDKGFVRPVRQSYRHIGIRPKYQLRDLTVDENTEHAAFNYISFEEYPKSDSPVIGRFWTRTQLESGCGSMTSMGLALAETYARDPSYYGATFCCKCGGHFPVAEFVWDGTSEIVGS